MCRGQIGDSDFFWEMLFDISLDRENFRADIFIRQRELSAVAAVAENEQLVEQCGDIIRAERLRIAVFFENREEEAFRFGGKGIHPEKGGVVLGRLIKAERRRGSDTRRSSCSGENRA